MTTTMAREIAEQPATVAATCEALQPRLDDLTALAAGCREVRFFARGTSDAAAVHGRYLVETHAGLPAALGSPSVATLYRRRLDLTGHLAVFLSQSGATEEIVDTLNWAAFCGARTVAVTNDDASPLARAADLAWTVRAGLEEAVPATKTYTAQLVALDLLGAALGRGRGVSAEALLRGIAEVPDAITTMLARTGRTDAAAEALLGAQTVVATGRGFTCSPAQETALKIAETSYRPVLGLSAADLEHGPIAVLDDRSALIAVAPSSGPVRDSLAAVAAKAAARGSTVLGIGGGDALGRHCRVHVPGPALPEEVAPAVLVVAGQLLAESLCRLEGLDPDQPRGLSKVTQTTGG